MPAEEIDVKFPMGKDGKTMHLGLEPKPNALASEVILVGDPHRARMIATTFLDRPRCVGRRREMWTYNGTHNGYRLSVVTTGMGGPSAGMVMKEVADCGGRTMISVGSCSTFWEQGNPGDVAICQGAVRLGATADNWAMRGFPAMADARLTCLLQDAARELGITAYTGLEATTDCFYEGQARSTHPDGWLPPHIQAQHEWLTRLHVLLYAMEGEAEFVWALAHSHLYSGGLRLGRVAAIFGNRVRGHLEYRGEEEAVKMAIRALELSREYPLPT